MMLCADDFALSGAISGTIARLARRGCVNAISCMAALPGWPQDARLLDGIEQVECGGLGPVQVGLHLVLASEPALGKLSIADAEGRLPGPDRMLALSLMRRLPLGEIEAEIERQFEAFRAARGRAPDFVDAHQHVHLYPGIRRLVIAATGRHAPDAWVRVPSDNLPAMLARPFAGKAIGSALHSLGMRRQLRRAGLRCNAGFAGHYDYSGGFRGRLAAFFRRARPGHLVMCHPGSGLAAGDTIARARMEEADVIAK